MSEKFKFIYLLVVAVIYYPNKTLAANQHRIEYDYYWGSSELRSQKQACDLTITRVVCYLRCGKDYICERDECKCNEEDKPMKMHVQTSDNDHHLYRHLYQHKQNKYSKQNAWLPEHLRYSTEQDTKIQSKREKPTERPALRHHIAHFCPNLDVARECITKCMKLGKPAFCGKDHVCYCGHKYSSHDDKEKIDVNDVYSQYRDIYEKYFGPQDTQSEIDYGENVTKT